MKTIEDIKKLVGLDNHHTNYGDIFRRFESIIRERDALKRGNNHENEAVSQLSDITKMLVESSMMRRNINSSVKALIELARPDTTQPQLSEIRYVLHGDIQPCSVLYSDDTTTLLRLDEGDMMLETDTIEWSDSVTYRCQELLRAARVPVSGNRVSLNTVKIMAQLVRDERILLNDNGDDEVKSCVAAVVVPAPPPFPRGVADHSNPYVHTTTLFSETAMRSQGWTNEALVSCGHGHYAHTTVTLGDRS